MTGMQKFVRAHGMGTPRFLCKSCPDASGTNSSSLFAPQPCLQDERQRQGDGDFDDLGAIPQIFVYIMITLASLLLLLFVIRWIVEKRDTYLRRGRQGQANESGLDDKLEARKAFIKNSLVVKQWEGEEIKDGATTVMSPHGSHDIESSESTTSSSTDGTSDSGGKNLAENSANVSLSVLNGEDELVYPSCAICLGVFQKGQLICESTNKTCAHIFHESCMMDWLERKTNCPICRQVYLPKEQEESKDKDNGVFQPSSATTAIITTTTSVPGFTEDA